MCSLGKTPCLVAKPVLVAPVHRDKSNLALLADNNSASITARGVAELFAAIAQNSYCLPSLARIFSAIPLILAFQRPLTAGFNIIEVNNSALSRCRVLLTLLVDNNSASIFNLPNLS